MKLSTEILLVALIGGACFLTCVVGAWLSMWGRLRLGKNPTNDPWGMREVVTSFLEISKIDLGNGEKQNVPTMSPDDALRLVIRTRQLAAASFLAVAALVVVCQVILVTTLLTQSTLSGSPSQDKPPHVQGNSDAGHTPRPPSGRSETGTNQGNLTTDSTTTSGSDKKSSFDAVQSPTPTTSPSPADE